MATLPRPAFGIKGFQTARECSGKTRIRRYRLAGRTGKRGLPSRLWIQVIALIKHPIEGLKAAVHQAVQIHLSRIRVGPAHLPGQIRPAVRNGVLKLFARRDVPKQCFKPSKGAFKIAEVVSLLGDLLYLQSHQATQMPLFSTDFFLIPQLALLPKGS